MTKNEIHALRAERTLSYYATLQRCDPKSSLIDLLIDFRHYCNNNGFGFDYFSMESKRNFEAETAEEYVTKPIV